MANAPTTPLLDNPDFRAPRARGEVRTDAELEKRFNELLTKWMQETMTCSDGNVILTHPAHLGLIALGIRALPLILNNLSQGGGPWFVALEAITLENPVLEEHTLDAKLMRQDWLNWGRQHGYHPA